jgi:hypothetical protein
MLFIILLFRFLGTEGMNGWEKNFNGLHYKHQEDWPNWIERPDLKTYGVNTYKMNAENDGIACVICEEFSKFTRSSKAKANYALGKAHPKEPGKLVAHMDSSDPNSDHNQGKTQWVAKYHSSTSTLITVATQSESPEIEEDSVSGFSSAFPPPTSSSSSPPFPSSPSTSSSSYSSSSSQNSGLGDDFKQASHSTSARQQRADSRCHPSFSSFDFEAEDQDDLDVALDVVDFITENAMSNSKICKLLGLVNRWRKKKKKEEKRGWGS